MVNRDNGSGAHARGLRPAAAGIEAERAIEGLPEELRAILREGARLEQAGLLDAAANARIDAQIQGTVDRERAEFEARIADIRAAPTPRPAWVVPKRARAPMLALICVVAVGDVLALAFNDGFFFRTMRLDEWPLPTVGIALLPICWVFVLLLQRNSPGGRVSPTPWVRRLFVIPALSVFLSAAFVLAPRGWTGRLLTPSALMPTRSRCESAR